MTVKGNNGDQNGLSRAEFEYPIPLEDANQLLDRLCQHSEWRGRSEKPEATYHWKADESVSKGLQRIVGEELQVVIWQLSENSAVLDEAVHEARKSLKKIRSALRLLSTAKKMAYCATPVESYRRCAMRKL